MSSRERSKDLLSVQSPISVENIQNGCGRLFNIEGRRYSKRRPAEYRPNHVRPDVFKQKNPKKFKKLAELFDVDVITGFCAVRKIAAIRIKRMQS